MYRQNLEKSSKDKSLVNSYPIQNLAKQIKRGTSPSSLFFYFSDKLIASVQTVLLQWPDYWETF